MRSKVALHENNNYSELPSNCSSYFYTGTLNWIGATFKLEASGLNSHLQVNRADIFFRSVEILRTQGNWRSIGGEIDHFARIRPFFRIFACLHSFTGLCTWSLCYLTLLYSPERFKGYVREDLLPCARTLFCLPDSITVISGISPGREKWPRTSEWHRLQQLWRVF